MEENEKTVDSAGTEDANATGMGDAKAADATLTRRSLCMGIGGAAAMLGLGSLRYIGHTPLRRPPGGQDESHLVSACIRCEKCVEACPRKVIIPAHLEDGLLGMRSPTLDFNTNYCNGCTEENDGHPRCVEVCPTQALRLPVDAKPQDTLIGLAVIDESQCLAYRDTGCRYCFEACPYDAIALGSEGKNPRPSVIADRCNGCGACESVCVSLKAGSIASGAIERAIVVKPLETL